MSTRLVLLGLLRERPLYGYELKSLIEGHMGDWTNIAFGSIYYALGKLAEEGFIDQVATEQEGNRPSRSVYQITPAGLDEFMRELRAVWRNFDRQLYPFDIALFFMSALPREEVLKSLQTRVDQLQQVLKHLDDRPAKQTRKKQGPPLARAILAHTRAHLQAELNWMYELYESVSVGEIP